MTKLVESDRGLKRILTSVKTIAMVGASDKPGRPSHRVMKVLLDKGFEVIPVNPKLAGKKVHGRKAVASLSEIGKPVDMVDIFRNPEAALPVVEEAIRIGAKVVWMQLGVINEEAAQKAADAGLEVVMDHCPAIEISRLGL